MSRFVTNEVRERNLRGYRLLMNYGDSFTLEFKLQGNTAQTSKGDGLGWSENRANEEYRSLLAQGYTFDYCRMYKNGEYQYVIS